MTSDKESFNQDSTETSEQQQQQQVQDSISLTESKEVVSAAELQDTDETTEVSDSPPKKGSLRTLREKAIAQYESMADTAQMQRLNYLLEKSTAYATFVSRKMELKREEMKKAEEKMKSRERRKQEKERSGEMEKDNKSEQLAHQLRRSARKRKNDVASTVEDDDLPTRKRPTKRVRRSKKSKLAVVDDDKSVDEESDAELAPERFIDGQKVSPRQPKLITGGIMREYQLEGMEWLTSLYENGLNGILADEMGLGKTLQTIAFLCFLRERKVFGPFLIVCPLSTLSNWVSEFYRFTPETPVLLYHGTPEERKVLRTKHLRKLDRTFPVVVTTYEITMRDKMALQRYAWKYIIIDEGHRIKNMDCKLVRELKSYQSANRLLLTGTPLQNSLAELWSLLNFLLPDIFDDLDSFKAWFDFDDINERSGQDRIISEESKNNIVSKLHHILQPFLLRRLKVDVEKFLPPKREYLISCPMAPVQFEYYQAVRGNDLRGFLASRITGSRSNGSDFCDAEECDAESTGTTINGNDSPTVGYDDDNDDSPNTAANSGTSTPQQQYDKESTLSKLRARRRVNKMNLQFRLMQQRKACNHPFIFDFPVKNQNDPESELLIDEQIVRSSGKLLVLDRLLPELFSRDHRVLIFSQMSRMLDILECYAELREWDYCRIDGSVGQEDRQSEIMRFNTNKNIPLFFLTTRSGGLGINLTSADTVVILDSDWNPQLDLQAQDRVHRIGQTKPVIVYRLAIAGTCESAIIKRAQAKRKLEKLVIHEKKFKGIRASAKDDSFSNSGNTTSANDGYEVSTQDIANILMSDDADVVERDQESLRKILESLGPDDPIPPEAIITDAELAALTDRTPTAYEKKNNLAKSKDGEMPSVTNNYNNHESDNVDDDNTNGTKGPKNTLSRFEQIKSINDERNDMLANMAPLS